MEVDLHTVLLQEISNGTSEWPSQQLQGQQRVVFRNGAVYDGNWVDGSMQGMGKLTFPDGIEYEGDFEANAMTGTGEYRWPVWPGRLGSSTYKGQVLDGKRHGQGTMSFANTPAVYTGGWAHGLRHGHGSLTFNQEGSHRYTGQWENDMKQGHGTMHYANGDQYEGDWARDAKCGQGKMSWKSTKQEYSGQWHDNAPNGIGTHVWFQQVSEKTDANHALLLMYNRYHGHFVNGQRNGFGIMYYATGARFEGQWVADQKQGLGCFVFENGGTWKGQFAEDRPVLAEEEQFAPKSSNVLMYIADVVDEEEVPAATIRAINNVAMVYNSDLRALYDLYCKRPSLHLMGSPPSASHTLLVAQFWELLSDARLVSSVTPLSKMSELLAQARRPPQLVQQFRQQMADEQQDPGNPEDVRYWAHLLEDVVETGAHSPRGEVLFPSFCEALVRIAAVRYRHLPGVERRLHALINTHLLGLVSKSKHTPPPRTAMHQALWSSETALQLIHHSQPMLRELFLHVASSSASSSGGGTSSSAGTGGQQEAAAPASSPIVVYQAVATVRGVVQALSKLGVLPDAAANMTAAHAFCHEYLQGNTFGQMQARATRQGWTGQVAADEAGGAAAVSQDPAEPNAEDTTAPAKTNELDEVEEREVMGWLDMPVHYPEFLEGVVRLAHLAPWLTEDDLAAKLAVLLQEPAPRGLVAALEGRGCSR